MAASPPKRANRLRASGEYEELPLSHEIGVLKHRCGDIILVMARVLLGEPAGNGGADRAHGDVDRPSATAASASSEGATLVRQVLGAVAQFDKSMMESCGSPAIASASATAIARRRISPAASLRVVRATSLICIKPPRVLPSRRLGAHLGGQPSGIAGNVRPAARGS